MKNLRENLLRYAHVVDTAHILLLPTRFTVVVYVTLYYVT